MLNVSDREEHAGKKLRATFINVEYAQKGAQNMSVLVMQKLLFQEINLSGDWRS